MKALECTCSTFGYEENIQCTDVLLSIQETKQLLQLILRITLRLQEFFLISFPISRMKVFANVCNRPARIQQKFIVLQVFYVTPEVNQ